MCRSFLTRAYPIMKKNNPSIPIMLREAQGTLPKVYARYGSSTLAARDAEREPGLLTFTTEFGKEKSEILEGAHLFRERLLRRRANRVGTGLSDKQIEETVTKLVKNEA